jgi:hypothetical protein
MRKKAPSAEQEQVMASDLVVALGQATVHGSTLFGSNCHADPDQRQRLRRIAGGSHPLDEPVRTTYLRLPQVRQTQTILGHQSEGDWGFTHGLNESHVAIGVTSWHSRMPALGGALTGTDLSRLALERSHTALHALDVLTDLIGRHGQCAEEGNCGVPADNLFLVADGREAYVLEAAGRFWAILECRQVRAVTDVALIRQDWHRIAPGLATLAIERGWWGDDGSKLDFIGCLGAADPSHAAGRRRWGRATLALEQQNGAIDGPFLRRMLFDHNDSSAARTHRAAAPLAGSFTTDLASAGAPALAWCAFGPPAAAVYFPVWLDGELPAALQGADGADVWRLTQDLHGIADGSEEERVRVAEGLERLQAIFEQDADAFLPNARAWKRQGELARLHNHATALMQKHVGLFAHECRQLHGAAETDAVSIDSGEFVSYIS